MDEISLDRLIQKQTKLNELLQKSTRYTDARAMENEISQIETRTKITERMLSLTRSIAKEEHNSAARQVGLSKHAQKRLDQYRDIRSRISAELNLTTRLEQAERRRIRDKAEAIQRGESELGVIKSQLETANKLHAAMEAQLKSAMEKNKTAETAFDLTEKLERLNEKIVDLTTKERNLLAEENAIRAGQSDALTAHLNQKAALIDATLYLNQIESIDTSRSRLAGLKNIFATLKKGIAQIPFIGKAMQMPLLSLFVGSLLMAGKKLSDAMKTAIEEGFSPLQRNTVLATASRIMKNNFMWLFDPNDIIRGVSAIGRELGTLRVPDSTATTILKLQKLSNVDLSDAAKLVSFYRRTQGLSEEVTNQSLLSVQAIAGLNDVLPKDLIYDLATNGDAFAKSAKASAFELASAAIQVRRMGIDVQKISGMADRLVSDFENTLTSQATIQTFVPGFDMSRLLVASQFGTDNDIARELQRSVNTLGKDFESMPRSFKLAIANSMGYSVKELMDIMRGDTSDIRPPTTQDIENIVNKQQQALVAGQELIANPLNTISATVTNIYSWLVTGGLLGSIKNFFNFMKKTPLGGPDIRLPSMEGRATGGTAGVDIGKPISLFNFFKKLKSNNEIPTMLHRGEAILNKAQMGMLEQLTTVKSTIGSKIKSMVGSVASSKLKSVGSGLLKAGASKMLGNAGFAKIGATLGSVVPGLGTVLGGGMGTALGMLANTKLGKKVTGTIGKITKNPIGKFALGMGKKALGRVFGKKKKPEIIQRGIDFATRNIPQVLNQVESGNIPVANNSISTGTSRNTTLSPHDTSTQMSAVEQRIIELIHLFKTGGIQVNIDGKKVTDALMLANRY